MHEQNAVVNDITISQDDNMFVTCSDDGTVKVWDAERMMSLKQNMCSILTYELKEGRALRTMILGGGDGGGGGVYIAVGSDMGTIDVFNGNCDGRITDVSRIETGEGSIVSLESFETNSPVLIYNTKENKIHVRDMRERGDSMLLNANKIGGGISDVVVGESKNRLVTGSTRGALTRWDLRFVIPVNTWGYQKEGYCFNKMCVVPNAIGTSDGPVVCVAVGHNNEITLWNVKNGKCHRVYKFTRHSNDNCECRVNALVATKSGHLIAGGDSLYKGLYSNS